MTTECKHENFAGNVTVNYLEDTGRWMADITISCGDCLEPFRFPGVNVGVAVTAPMVSFDGTELRAPIEPLSYQQARESRVPGSQRYVLEVTRSVGQGAGGAEAQTVLLAHDQWHLGAGCSDRIAAVENPTYKPAIPSAYGLCRACYAQELADNPDRGARQDEGRQLHAMPGDYVEDAAGRHQATSHEVVIGPSAADVQAQIYGASQVVGLEAQPGDEEPADGQPKAAQAAVFVAPDVEGGSGDEPPVGAAVPRQRPARGGRR